MEMAMKVAELSMEPRELTIEELDEASAGLFFLGLAAGIGLGIVIGWTIAHYWPK
jgi:hypothetical protein